jgi:hypothetical protein
MRNCDGISRLIRSSDLPGRHRSLVLSLRTASGNQSCVLDVQLHANSSTRAEGPSSPNPRSSDARKAVTLAQAACTSQQLQIASSSSSLDTLDRPLDTLDRPLLR